MVERRQLVPNPTPFEKGLCHITIDCPSEISESSETLCRFTLGDSAGTLQYDDHAALSIRGRSSVGFPKKNYKVELRTSADVDNPTNLLGMGQEADWVLDGAWADRSFMRNRLTFGLFRDANATHWAPRGRYCEVTLDAEYAGIYVLLERIKRDDDRLNLPEDDGTGKTFIVKQDDDGTLSLSIGVGSKWQLVYPNDARATTAQSSAVQTWLNRFGAALKSTNPQDLLVLVDRAAIVDFILVEEFAKNIDAYNLSLHFVRSNGGPAWLVPWDVDSRIRATDPAELHQRQSNGVGEQSYDAHCEAICGSRRSERSSDLDGAYFAVRSSRMRPSPSGSMAMPRF
ncbi:MAG: CotH kinase family protein [Polyangiaceae bacterium]